MKKQLYNMIQPTILKIKNNHDFFIVESSGYTATWYKNIKFLVINERTTHQRFKFICNNKTTVFKKIDEVIPYN